VAEEQGRSPVQRHSVYIKFLSSDEPPEDMQINITNHFSSQLGIVIKCELELNLESGG
jgi:hypothetical protein